MEILETQVHGGRVRGRIIWEEEDLEGVERGSGKNRLRRKEKKSKKKKKSLLEKRPKRKSKMFQRGRAKKKEDDGTHEDDDDDSVWEENMVKYSGWISVQWADEEDEEGNAAARLGSGSDEDAGPWTGKCSFDCLRSVNFFVFFFHFSSDILIVRVLLLIS